tara:strand:+ start:4385 stop:5029 length:645 start_codon:yes stop_codon:yes gene_type:complete
MKIYCVGYRSWSLQIYENLKKKTKHKFKIIKNKKKISYKEISKFDPDYILFYGWSDKIPNSIINKYFCIMLHPSPLPKFRGGSPLQNQIIRNIKTSKITLFKMDKRLDAGPIIIARKFSLEGHLNEIFNRLTVIGTALTLKVFKNNFKLKKQNDKIATYFKRRKPEESEITLNEIKNKSSKYLINKIRMLEDPYPNAYIKTKDGKKIIIKSIQL